MNFRILICVFFALFSIRTISAGTPVLLNLCNTYPASTVQWTWDGVVSSKVDFQSCTTITVNDTVTSGTMSLIGTSQLNIPVSVPVLCTTDADRNLVIAYNNNTILAASVLSLISGCNKLVTNTVILNIFDGNCGLGTTTTGVDMWIISTGANPTTSKFNPNGPVFCGVNSPLNLPLYAGANSGGTTTLLVNTANTQNKLAQFDITNAGAPAPLGTLTIFVAGTTQTDASVWWAATQPAGKSASGALTQYANPQNAMIIAIIMFVVALFNKF